MKKLFLYAAALIAALSTAIPSAQAATATGTFDVVLTLNTSCTVDTTALAPTITYTSGAGAAVIGGTSGFGVTCTNGVNYALSLDIAGGVGYTYGVIADPAYQYVDTATGLTYTLTVPAEVAGTGAAQAYTLGVAMTAPQAGTCTSAQCVGTNNHTLTLTY